MTGPTCPSCAAAIPTADLNIAEGVALCRACGGVARLSEILPSERPGADIAWDSAPPPGCALLDDGAQVRVIASARSFAAAGVSLAFALFWNGVVGIFVALVALSLWTHLVGPLPSWVPGQFRGSRGSATLPLALAIGGTLFLIPFVMIGVYMLLVAILAMFGHIRVTLHGGDGVVFTGVGAVGRRQQFNALSVTGVRLIDATHDDSRTQHILIDTHTKLKFGSILTERRRAWMTGVLRTMLIGDGATRGRATLPPVPDSGPPLPPS